MISKKLQPFGTTIFTEMTQLANRHNAINLAQGFPDFDGPDDLIEEAYQAMRAGENQYARSMGHPRLVQAIADKQRRLYGLEYSASEEVVVFCGATEGLASSMLGLLNPGDEVILFEPFYDSYPACVALAHATPRYCTLRYPDFRITEEDLRPLFNSNTRLLLINTPHNPSGRVFSTEELELVARLCIEHDVLVLSDEVYEHLLFDGTPHRSIAALPGMRERTLCLSSTGKTYSMTGWKVGWATGPRELVAAAQAAHQFITFAIATPMQVAMAAAIEKHQEDYFDRFRADYTERRDFLMAALESAGFVVCAPQGTYFILADFRPLFEGTDWEFARQLIEQHQVAAIPPSVFYRAHPEEGQFLLRFAFCKRMETLQAAAENLKGLQR